MRVELALHASEVLVRLLARRGALRSGVLGLLQVRREGLDLLLEPGHGLGLLLAAGGLLGGGRVHALELFAQALDVGLPEPQSALEGLDVIDVIPLLPARLGGALLGLLELPAQLALLLGEAAVARLALLELGARLVELRLQSVGLDRELVDARLLARAGGRRHRRPPARPGRRGSTG